MDIEPGGSESLLKIGVRTVRPAGASILELALSSYFRWPSVRQGRQVYFSGCDCRGLPINGVNPPVTIKNVARVILAMNDRLRRPDQTINEFFKSLAYCGQPREALLQLIRE